MTTSTHKLPSNKWNAGASSSKAHRDWRDRANTSRTPRTGWEEEQSEEVVAVEAEAVCEPASASDGHNPPPLTIDDARVFWKDLQDLGEEPPHVGYPAWVLERLEATIVDYEPAEFFNAHVQMQALESAEAAQVLQARMDASSRLSDEGIGASDDDHSLVQTGLAISTVGGATESFALHVDKMAAELADMKEPRQKAEAQLLCGYLSKRHGSGLGRMAMGDKARILEALVGAYGISQNDTCDCGESSEDVAWATTRWSRVIPALMKDDAQLRNQEAFHVEDSYEGLRSQSSTDVAGPEPTTTPHADREIFESQSRQEQQEIDQATAEYEEARDQARADEKRWEVFRAMQLRVLREWEDWQLQQHMGVSAAMRTHLKVAVSLQRQTVEPTGQQWK